MHAECEGENTMKSLKLLAAGLAALLSATAAYAQTQEYRTVYVDSPYGMQALFDQYGAQGWMYSGEINDHVIFRQSDWPVQYQMHNLEYVGNMQAFLGQLGAEGWLYLGEEEDLSIFMKVGYAVGYYVTSFEYMHPSLIPGTIQELGLQGFRYLGEEEDHQIFMQMGYPQYYYATPILPEWRPYLPDLINEVGAGGWDYLGEAEDNAVFIHIGTPVEYQLIGEYRMPDYQGFLNQYGAQGWTFRDTDEGYIILTRGAWPFPY